jgi:hypothetical protein
MIFFVSLQANLSRPFSAETVKQTRAGSVVAVCDLLLPPEAVFV